MPITIKRKKELLGLVSNIGRFMHVLEQELYIEGIARPQVQELRHSLEVVRSTVAVQPEKEAGQ